MSLGPVNNSQFTQQTQQTKTVAPASKTEGTTQQSDATNGTQPTNTPTEAERVQANPEAQDAARQMNRGVENQIKNQLDQGGRAPDGEWLEARRRTRGTRGGRQMAQGPTRGLGTPPDVA